MKAQLTITLDKELIAKAKYYANESGKSLSEIIENYLKAILVRDFEEIEITPLTRSLFIKTDLTNDFDYKEELTKILIEKYK